MSQRDSSTSNKAQGGDKSEKGQKRSGTTRYKMQAVQAAQEEAARLKALDIEQKREAAASAIEAESESSPEEDNVRGLWKNRVLASYKGKNAKDSHTLLAKIPDGKATVKVGDHYKTTNLQEAMIALVDRMFDTFQNCAYEFNQHAAGTELEMHWIRPFLSKETISTWHQGDGFSLVFSGRISTRRWTMVVKGTQDEVMVYILPADKLIGFALSHKNYRPFFGMEPYNDGLDVAWRSGDHRLPAEAFPTIYRELFQSLIRHAKDEAEPSEFFDLTKIGIKLPAEDTAATSTDTGKHRAYQEAFFAEMRAKAERSTSDFGSGTAPQTPGLYATDPGIASRPREVQRAAPTYVQPLTPPQPPAAPPPLPQIAAPVYIQPLTPPQPPAPPQQPQMYQQPPAGWPGGPPVPPLAVPPPVQPGPAMPPPAMPQSGPLLPPSLPQTQQQMMMMLQMQQQAKAAQTAGRPEQPFTFPAALSLLLSTLDKELEIVAKAGADAFAARDLTRADAALKFSGRLSEFRTVAQELLEYYKRR